MSHILTYYTIRIHYYIWPCSQNPKDPWIVLVLPLCFNSDSLRFLRYSQACPTRLQSSGFARCPKIWSSSILMELSNPWGPSYHPILGYFGIVHWHPAMQPSLLTIMTITIQPPSPEKTRLERFGSGVLPQSPRALCLGGRTDKITVE